LGGLCDLREKSIALFPYSAIQSARTLLMTRSAQLRLNIDQSLSSSAAKVSKQLLLLVGEFTIDF
jgi:hypothetical protein